MLFLRWRTHNMPSLLTAANTSGNCCWTSANICLSDSTAKSRPETLKGPTSTPNFKRFLNWGNGLEQFLVSLPGFPSLLSMVDSLAELSPVFIASLGGIGTRSVSLLIIGLLCCSILEQDR